MGNCQVINLFYSTRPFTFIAGDLDEVALEAAAKLCHKNTLLYCNPIYHNWFLTRKWQTNLRVQLSYIEPSIKSITPGLIVRPIDNMDIFQRCQDFEFMSRRYGSAENFLKYSTGLALCNDREVLSEVYEGYIWNKSIEITIITNPEYRGLGYGSQIASYFAENCVKQGQIPLWSCRASNLGSLKTALNIGFRIVNYYVQLLPVLPERN